MPLQKFVAEFDIRRSIDTEETWVHWIQYSVISYLDCDLMADRDPCLLVLNKQA